MVLSYPCRLCDLREVKVDFEGSEKNRRYLKIRSRYLSKTMLSCPVRPDVLALLSNEAEQNAMKDNNELWVSLTRFALLIRYLTMTLAFAETFGREFVIYSNPNNYRHRVCQAQGANVGGPDAGKSDSGFKRLAILRRA